jgi:hypothetical protein
MVNLEAAETRLSFDDILEAVQDSRRGRWFLTEYEARIHKRDTQSILNSLNRLESRMESLGSNNSSPDELVRVRGAIANARNDLLKLGLGKEALSKEGRLFAEIADLARKSMPVAVDSNAGIVRTLQLVDEIDSTILGHATADKGAQYFSADAALFEKSAAPAKPVLIAPTVAAEPAAASLAAQPETSIAAPVATAPVAAKPEKKEEAAPVGARLVIRKVGQAAEAKTPDPSVETTQPVAEKPAEALSAQPQSAVETEPTQHVQDNPRIVIIRRKAEDMPDVDLSTQRTETAA